MSLLCVWCGLWLLGGRLCGLQHTEALKGSTQLLIAGGQQRPDIGQFGPQRSDSGLDKRTDDASQLLRAIEGQDADRWLHRILRYGAARWLCRWLDRMLRRLKPDLPHVTLRALDAGGLEFIAGDHAPYAAK